MKISVAAVWTGIGDGTTDRPFEEQRTRNLSDEGEIGEMIFNRKTAAPGCEACPTRASFVQLTGEM